MNTYDAIELDEFGRDLSMRRTETEYYSIFPKEYIGLSWFEIGCLEDEKREIQAENDRIKKITMERKMLYQQGEYELEDGEIFE